jgi:hypothetical protein
MPEKESGMVIIIRAPPRRGTVGVQYVQSKSERPGDLLQMCDRCVLGSFGERRTVHKQTSAN